MYNIYTYVIDYQFVEEDQPCGTHKLAFCRGISGA